MADPSKPNNSETTIRRIFALIGFLLVVFGQYWVFSEPATLDKLPPSTFVISGVGLLLFLVSFFIRLKPAQQARLQKLAVPRRVIWILAAIVFSGLAVFSMLMFSKLGKNTYLPVLTLWFAAGAFYIFSFRGSLQTLTTVKRWLRDHRAELLLVAGITLVAALLRLYKLGVYPRVIDGDEGLLGLFAQSTVAGTYANPFALWENFGALYLQFVYFAIRIFGPTPLALRILPAISGILAIPALYLLARQIAGKKVALLSIAMLAISHTHINFSRIGAVGYIHGTWLIPLELFLLLRGLEMRKTWLTAASGVLLAIHFSVYLSSQVVIGLILVFMVILLIFKRKWFLKAYRQALAFWGGFLIMIMPELVYIIKNPGAFLNRLTQDGSFQTGWLSETMANTGQSLFQVLLGRVYHAFMSLIYYPSLDFYGSSYPMLSLFVSVFFLIGLVVALVKIRKTGMLLLNGYFWALTLAIGIFAIPPSADSYRMLVALPAALLLAATGINELLERIGAGWNHARQAYLFVTIGLVMSLAIFNLWVYYGDFVGQCRYGGEAKSRFASYLGEHVTAVEPGSNIYLLSDDIFLYGTHASTDFLSGNKVIINSPGSIDQIPAVTGDTIIASPNRITEMNDWIQLHPGGEFDFIYDCQNLILLSYQIP